VPHPRAPNLSGGWLGCGARPCAMRARAAIATLGQREDVGCRPAGGTTEGGGGAQGLGEELVDDDGDGVTP
jgi:hypothetical protein